MDEIFASLTTYMMIGIVIVIGVSQVNRVAGAIMSVVFWLAVAVVGSSGYEDGHVLGLPGFQFSQPIFLAVCVGFASLHIFAAVGYVRSKRRAEERRRLLSGEDE